MASGLRTVGRTDTSGGCLAMLRVGRARMGVAQGEGGGQGQMAGGCRAGGRAGAHVERCRARADNGLGEKAGAAIAEALKVNRTVHTLDLSGAWGSATAACSGRGLQ